MKSKIESKDGSKDTVASVLFDDCLDSVVKKIDENVEASITAYQLHERNLLKVKRMPETPRFDDVRVDRSDANYTMHVRRLVELIDRKIGLYHEVIQMYHDCKVNKIIRIDYSEYDQNGVRNGFGTVKIYFDPVNATTANTVEPSIILSTRKEFEDAMRNITEHDSKRSPSEKLETEMKDYSAMVDCLIKSEKMSPTEFLSLLHEHVLVSSALISMIKVKEQSARDN